MITITFQAVTAYLLDNEPDWSEQVTLTASLPTDEDDVGLTKREARKRLGDTLRLNLRYRTVLRDGQVSEFRNALQAHTTERVLCPLWCYPFDAGDTPEVTAAYYVLLGDGSAPEIKTHAQLPFARPAFPMLVGRFKSRPDPSLLTDDVAIAAIDFAENDQWHISLPAFTPPDGLEDGSGMRPLFPFRPNWATRLQSGGANVDVERQEIGYSRATAEAYYEEPSRRPIGLAFTLQDSEPWELLRMFLDGGATVESFWLPTGLSDLRLVEDVADIATEIEATGEPGDNTAILLDDQTNRVATVIDAPTGDVYPIDPAPGFDFDKDDTRVESLALCRFARPSIELRFESPVIVSTSLRFIELPWEVAAVAGETFGTTIGELPTCAYLYRFTIAYPGASVVYRFTSFERDLTNSAQTYSTNFFEHDTIRESAILDRQQTTITSRMFVGNPLALLIPFSLEWPLQIEIIEADVTGSAASNLRTVFSGEVASADFDGPIIKAACKSLSSLIDRRIPRWLMQPTANCALFDSKCGLDRDDWKWQGTVDAFNAGTMEIALSSVARVSGPAETLSQHYFAGGFLVLGSGSTVQYRTIGDSTAEVAGELTLVVASPFTTNPAVAATVIFHPGCDGRYTETCIGKFNNGPQFVGFPWMPPGNPSMIKVSKEQGGGKK